MHIVGQFSTDITDISSDAILVKDQYQHRPKMYPDCEQLIQFR